MIEAAWSGDGTAKVGNGSIKVDLSQTKPSSGEKILLGMRPEHFVVASNAADAVRVTVDVTEYLGGTRYLYCQTEDGQAIIAEYRDGPEIERGDTLHLYCPSERRRYFDKQGDRLR